MNTPYVADAHVGLRDGQSKHTCTTGDTAPDSQVLVELPAPLPPRPPATSKGSAPSFIIIIIRLPPSLAMLGGTPHTWFSGLAFNRLKAATRSSAVTYLDMLLAVQARAARAPSYPASGPGGGSNGDHAAQEALVNDHPHEYPDKHETLVEVHTVSVLPKASFAVSIAKSFEQVVSRPDLASLPACSCDSAIPHSTISASSSRQASLHNC